MSLGPRSLRRDQAESISRLTRETLARADRGDNSIGLDPHNLAREASGGEI